jgi:hypothetical protein
MAWRPHGRAKVNPANPRAWAICDRCGFTYNLVDLTYQMDWQGPAIINTRLLVCSTCDDEPTEQQRAIALPPDPPPVLNPRPPRYSVD